MRICILSLLLFLAFAVQAVESFFIPWNAEGSHLGYRSDGNWRTGPQAIGVDKEGQVYILDRLAGKVVMFSGEGRYLKSMDCQEGCGLSVSPNGEVAVFSPSAKTVTWINGAMAGTTATAPDSFSTLSEVWFEQGAWRGRCGWQTCTLLGERDKCPMPSVFAISENEIALRIVGTDEQLVTLHIAETFFNAWTLGSLCDSKRLCVVLQVNGGLDLFVCDLNGNRSQKLHLDDSWTEVFSPYAIAPDKSLYQLVTEESGISIRCFPQFSKISRQVGISRQVPQSLRDFLASPAQVQSEKRSTANINVYFRNEGKVRTVRLQDYLKGVVSAEIYGNWLIEAHKAMAVAARTYSLAYVRHPETYPKAMVCTSTHCQAWTSNIGWKAAQAVDSTDGEVIYYKGTRIKEALYFAHCNGHTRNSEEKWNYFPYLRKKSCPCGYTSYYGHGVGACQWGLQAYAKKGWNYRAILQYYYTNTTVKK